MNRCFDINSGIFDFPIILKFTLYNPVITIIPASRLVTFNFTWIIPVISPATAPANIATTKAISGFTPFTISAALTAAPNGKLPSTVISGKSNILYDI